MRFNLFHTLQYLGLQHVSDALKYRILLTNQIALVLFVVAFPYTYLFYLVKPHLGFMVIPTLIAFALVLILNRLKCYLLSRIFLLAVANIAVLYFSCVVGRDAGVQYLYFAFIGMPIALFDYKEKWLYWGGVFFPIGCQILLELSHFQLFSSVYISPDFQRLINLTAVFSVLFIIGVYLKFVITTIESSRILLSEALDNLKQSRSVQETMATQVAYVDLVRNISHEFKNPIAMMMTRCEIILTRSERPEWVDTFARMILRNLTRLDSLVKPMLDYSFSKSHVSFADVSVQELLDDLVELSFALCFKKNITLAVAPCSDAVIYCDRDLVFQALVNLVANAIQYTDEGGRIDISVSQVDYVDPGDVSRRGLEIQIKDSGCCIPEDQLLRVFEPHFTTQAGAKNAGLGLSIAFRMIIENKGLLTVSSRVGEGSVFSVILPRV